MDRVNGHMLYPHKEPCHLEQGAELWEAAGGNSWHTRSEWMSQWQVPALSFASSAALGKFLHGSGPWPLCHPVRIK